MKPGKIRLAGWLLLLGCVMAQAGWRDPELSHDLTVVSHPVHAGDFSLQDMDENTVRLSDYHGQVVMVNFWATWCPPCVREMPSMEKLNRHFKGRKFKILALNQMEDEDQVFAFTAQLELEPGFPILLDSKSRVASRFHINGLPTTYLIDKKGYVRYRAIGGRVFDHPEVIETIERLLDE